jgi:hypothetical protein
VDVADASGGASAAELQRVARNVGYWPFRHCYEEGLRRDQKMGGKVSPSQARRCTTRASSCASRAKRST